MQLITKILIIDDDRSIRLALSMTLEGTYSILSAGSGAMALKLIDEERPDLILLDIGLPDIDGVTMLKQIKTKFPKTAVIMITAVEDVKTVVETVKLGAYDYIVKPVDAPELFLSIHNALEHQRLKHQLQAIQKTSRDRYRFDLIGQSPEIKAVLDIARKASVSIETPILIVGETGTGKGVLAKAIHYSKNDPGPFVMVNCGAIAKDLIESELFGYEKGAYTGANTEGKQGRFEEAAGGTLFLDEIGAMPLDAQVKLLGVLEDRQFYRICGTRKIEVASRIIAATNADIETAVEKGNFRKDLYYRLNVVQIAIPPLRDRKDDIILLTTFFKDQFNLKFGKHFHDISPEALDILLAYPWPGNIRELKNVMERIILLENDTRILSDHLPEILTKAHSLALAPDTGPDPMDYPAAVRQLIQKALGKSRGNVSEAAKLLNIPAHKLRYRIKKFGIKTLSSD